MAGAMRKMGVYLGLVEDEEDRRLAEDEYDDFDDLDDEPVRAVRQRAAVRPFERPMERTAPATRGDLALDARAVTRPQVAPAGIDESGPQRITTLHPRTYNEARVIGEHFREGVPVIMDLTDMDDNDAKRLVDFAAGLSFGLRGSIERVTNKVFLISPASVDVTAEQKARIAEGGFFNQS